MISSTKRLLLTFCPLLFFALVSDMQWRDAKLALAYSLGILALALLFDLKKRRELRVAVLCVVFGVVLWFLSVHPAESGLDNVDARIFFSGAQAVKENLSPYVGLNLGFPPTYALCALLGDSFREFERNLLLVDLVSSVSSLVIIAGAFFLFLIKQKEDPLRIAERLLQVAIVIVLFHYFFEWNRALGNLCTVLALLVVLVMVSHHFDRPFFTGLVLGCAISIKPYFLSVGVGYFIRLLVRRDKRSLVVITAVALVLCGTALLLQLVPGGLGSDTYMEFLGRVSRENIPGMLDNVDNISAWATLRNMLMNLGVAIRPYHVSGFTLLLSLLFYGLGAILAIKDERDDFPMDHLVYFLFLTTAIYPLLWERYFSWIIAPAIYALCEIGSTEEGEKLMPAFLLCCFVLLLRPLAWIGALALPLLFLVHVMQKQNIRFGVATKD